MTREKPTGIVAAACLAASAHAASADENNRPQLPTYQYADTVQTRRSTPAPSPPEPQRFALSLGGLYTHRHGETAGWLPNFQLNYEATDKLELHFMAPLAFDRLSGGPTHYGIGDVEIGARYRFLDENVQSWEPGIAFYPLLDFPTGSQRDNLGTGSTHAFLPL